MAVPNNMFLKKPIPPSFLKNPKPPPKEPTWFVSITIYTDGCCSKAKEVGGAAFVAHIQEGSSPTEVSKQCLMVGAKPLVKSTTSRAEIEAALLAYELVKATELLRGPHEHIEYRAWTDSQMVQKTLSEWLLGWSINGWKTAGGDDVKNQDLWKPVLAFPAWGKVDWKWVKGHAGVLGNELCDYLAGIAKESALYYSLNQASAQSHVNSLVVSWAEWFLADHGHAGAMGQVVVFPPLEGDKQ